MQLPTRSSFFLCVLVVSLISAISTYARAQAVAPEVATAEYKFPATIDPMVLEGRATELWARAFWPKNLTKPHPIIFVMHGNQSTCRRDGSATADNCSYSKEGACPVGYSVVRSHDGFKYLGNKLASLGYIVVSINSNRGISCGGSDSLDWGLNLARGRLVLRHIEQWNKWATDGGAPASLNLPARAFVGHVDLTNVGLVGHSRAGEGMRAAFNLYRETNSTWPSLIPNLQIRGILEIGATDGQAGRVLDADDTAWNAVLPMCDGDSYTHDGRLPFERMIMKTSEIRKTPKSMTMVYGANHNFFNTEWKTNDSKGCENHQPLFGTGQSSPRQQDALNLIASSFFLANVGTERSPEKAAFFDPQSKLPLAATSLTRIDRDHIYTPDETFNAVVDDFDQPTGKSSSRKSNEASGVDVEHLRLEKPNRALVKWSKSGSGRYFQTSWMAPNQGRNVNAYTSLDFRVGRLTGHEKLPPTDFTVALVDSAGKLSQAIPVSQFIVLDGPNTHLVVDVMSEMNNRKTELFQTVRIPLQMFGLKSTTKIQGVRFIFDRSPKGALNFANIRFSRNDPEAFADSLNEPLPPIDPVTDEEPEEKDPFQANVVDNGWTINSPPKLPAKLPPIKQTAKFLKSRYVQNSAYLRGEPGYELAVESNTNFPVEGALPTLNIAGNKFSNSRYSDTGRTDTLIFTLRTREFSKLPNTAEAQVQYGRFNPQKVWTLPTFDKAQLAD